MLSRTLLLTTAIAGCTHASPPAKLPPPAVRPADSPELSPALKPLAWWLGTWMSQDRTPGNDGSETWVAAGGALYGIALHTGAHFEVLLVDDAAGAGPADGQLRLYAMPEGKAAVEFAAQPLAPNTTAATFANAAHAWPTTVGYARAHDALVATIGDAPRETIRYVAAPAAPAPELEAADLAFAKATAAQGAAGWVAAFAPDGAMGRKAARIEHDAIAAEMTPLLAAGKLAWAPIASGKLGDLGFTVGKAHFEPTSGKPEDAWRSTYVTIWERVGDTWKVRYDTGRAVNEPAIR